MLHVVEKSMNINIYYILKSVHLHEFVTLCQCVFGASVWSEAIAPLMKFCFTNRL